MIHAILIPDHPHPMQQTVRLTAPRSGVVIELDRAGSWLVLPGQRLSLNQEKLREVLATWFVCAESTFTSHQQIKNNTQQEHVNA